MFQSTRPQGARHLRTARAARARHRFNPRARRGRDGCGERLGDSNATVSIHAPAGGATRLHDEVSFIPEYVSIHAPAGGATGGTSKLSRESKVSIHAPAGGATSATAHNSAQTI